MSITTECCVATVQEPELIRDNLSLLAWYPLCCLQFAHQAALSRSHQFVLQLVVVCCVWSGGEDDSLLRYGCGQSPQGTFHTIKFVCCSCCYVQASLSRVCKAHQETCIGRATLATHVPHHSRELNGVEWHVTQGYQSSAAHIMPFNACSEFVTS